MLPRRAAFDLSTSVCAPPLSPSLRPGKDGLDLSVLRHRLGRARRADNGSFPPFVDDSRVNALTEQDADRLLEGVARIAEPLTLSSLRAESILVVHSLIPSVSASWNEINATGTIDAVSVPEVVRWPGMDEAFARALAGHPVIAHTRKTNDGRPRHLRLLVHRPVPRQLAVPGLYQRLSTEDQLSFTVPTPDVLIGVAINS